MMHMMLVCRIKTNEYDQRFAAMPRMLPLIAQKEFGRTGDVACSLMDSDEVFLNGDSLPMCIASLTPSK